MDKPTERHMVLTKGRWYWVPSPRAKREGFTSEALGAEEEAATRRARELNHAYDMARSALDDSAIPEAMRRYLRKMVSNSQVRARRRGLQWDITYEFLARMLLKQKSRCAITGMVFSLDQASRGASGRMPFAPSIDRMDGHGGYTPTNVRLLCVMTNIAINEWGEDAFFTLLAAMKRKGKSEAESKLAENGGLNFGSSENAGSPLSP